MIVDNLQLEDTVPADWFSSVANVLNADAIFAQGPTTDSEFSTEVGDVAGMAVSWTSVPNMVYRVSGIVAVQKTGSAGLIEVIVRDGTTLIWQASPSLAVAEVEVVPFSFLESFGSAGTRTRKLSLRAASGTLGYIGTFGRRGHIIVEPVGYLP